MNENRYKEAFKAVAPSEEAVERIYEITTDKKKFSYKTAIRRVAAAAMALAIATGIGFGADFMKESKYESNANISTTDNSNTLGVLVAYADEKGFIEIKNLSERKLFYRVYVQDYSDKEKAQQIKNELESDIKKEEDFMDRNANNGKNGGYGVHGEPILDPNATDEEVIDPALDALERITIGFVNTLSKGHLALDLDDYKNVKDITFENSSKYGELDLYYITDQEVKEDELPLGEFLKGNKITITGKKLQYSLETGRLASGLGKYEVNKGYRFNWKLAAPFYEELQEDLNFDFTKIKDTITFTVNYLDGKTEYATVDISFDKDGYMHLSDNSLTE